MNKRYKIYALVPNRIDATSFYRASGPFSDLKKRYRDKIDIEYTNNESISWETLGARDILFMQRPYADNHLEVVKMARMNNMPIWIDYDDNLFEVPKDNPAYDLYNNEDVKRNIATIIASADVVTVSTSTLKSHFGTLNKNIIVIPNSINTRLFPRVEIDYKNAPKVVFWRGSNTHTRDLMYYSEEIIKLITKHKDWTWLFLGYNPWFVNGALSDQDQKRILFHKGIDPVEYMRKIMKLQPMISHVPLFDCKFNKAKSNIAYLETAISGATCTCPDFPEWEVHGVLNYKNKKEYFENLNSLMSGDFDFERINKEAIEFIYDVYDIKKANTIRMEIIDRIIDDFNLG